MTEPTTQRVTADFRQAMKWFNAGRHPEAAAACRELLASDPRHSRALHMLSLILADDGRVAEGLACAEQALRLDPGHLGIQTAHGRLLLYAGRYHEAIATLKRVLSRDAGNTEAHHYLAIALQHAGRLDEAEQAARKALELRPDTPQILDNLGSIRLRLGDPVEARACFERALQIRPGYSAALGNLALLDERSNRVEAAMQLVMRGLAEHPNDVTLRLVLGRCQRRCGDYLTARATFESLNRSGTPALQKDVEYELALCCDALDQSEAAFTHASRANKLAWELWPPAQTQTREFMQLLATLREQYTQEWVSTWTTLPTSATHTFPIFLTGFARSGTTLLDTMLGAHPALTLLEELPTGAAMIDSLSRIPEGYPGALAGLTLTARATLEQSYYRVAAPAGAGNTRRILDKSPFLTAHLGLIQRVFPGAPILFMLRHPCDVVLSCFLTNFELNSGTAHFTELDRTVELYCALLSLWRVYREVLTLNIRMVRYEDLIAQPEKELRGILSFINLPWSPEVLEHATHAAMRGRINSASYAQVGQPVYKDAHDRWRRYRKYLEPYLPQLQPYCEMFGYEL